MAVAKIRKMSSWAMLITVAISAIVFSLFYFGGVDEPFNGKWKNPTYTEEVILWFYVMLGLCVISMVLFGVMQFASNFQKNAKSSLITLGILASFVLLLVLAYSLGDGTPLEGINSSSQKYNVEGWLRITDMWIYTMDIMLGLAIILIIAGSVKKMMNK